MRRYAYAAVLFDMDGTLIDNVRLHQAVWREFTAQHGLALSDGQLEYAVGRKALEVVEHFWPRKTPGEVAQLTEARQVLYRSRLADSALVRIVPGAVAFLTRLGHLGVPRVLATDAPRGNVDAVFRKFPLAPYFETVITSDSVRHGKPNPEIYVAAAKSVLADPAECLVAEDSPAGVAAAKAARCACLGLATSQSAADLLKEGADFAVSDFAHLPGRVAGL